MLARLLCFRASERDGVCVWWRTVMAVPGSGARRRSLPELGEVSCTHISQLSLLTMFCSSLGFGSEESGFFLVTSHGRWPPAASPASSPEQTPWARHSRTLGPVIDGLAGLVKCKREDRLGLRRLSTEAWRAQELTKGAISWCLSYQTAVSGDGPSP